MRPFILPSTLACGIATTEMIARTRAEKQPPHLVVDPGAKPAAPSDFLVKPMAFTSGFFDYTDTEWLPLRTTAAERSKPNQPWYSKFEGRRKRGKKKGRR